MKISNERHHHAKYLWCERRDIHILSIIYFLQIVTNHNTSFILEEKIVRVRLISEYSFQWYQLIIVSLIDDLSRLSCLNNVVFHFAAFKRSSVCECRNITLQWRSDFDKLLMWNLNDDVVFISNSDAFVLKTIIIAVWNTRILVIFSLIQVVFAKSFENFRTRFSWTMLTTFIRELIFLDVNTFSEAFSVSKSSFDNFDEFKQKELFFRKEMLFSLFNDWFFRERLIISFSEVSFRERNFDISIATKVLIDADSNDDVSSNIDNWNSIDDEISFFIIDFETTFFRRLFNTCFRIDILSYCFSSLFSNICSEMTRYVT
jgi:hypothetical protein